MSSRLEDSQIFSVIRPSSFEYSIYIISMPGGIYGQAATLFSYRTLYL